MNYASRSLLSRSFCLSTFLRVAVPRVTFNLIWNWQDTKKTISANVFLLLSEWKNLARSLIVEEKRRETRRKNNEVFGVNLEIIDHLSCAAWSSWVTNSVLLSVDLDWRRRSSRSLALGEFSSDHHRDEEKTTTKEKKKKRRMSSRIPKRHKTRWRRVSLLGRRRRRRGRRGENEEVLCK